MSDLGEFLRRFLDIMDKILGLVENEDEINWCLAMKETEDLNIQQYIDDRATKYRCRLCE